MALTLPPAKNYQSPLFAVPSILLDTPPDGPRIVPLEFDWQTMGAVNGAGASMQTAVYVNFANNSNLAFSQIASLKVDNSQCGCDVLVVFQDTSETVLIPAYEPNAIFPVFTALRQFYAIALGMTLPNDVTRILALNFVPPPVALNAGVDQNYTLTTGLPVGNAAGNVQIIPATVSGTLTNLQLNFAIAAGPAAASNGSVFVQDGGGNYLVNSLSIQAGPSTSTPGLIVLDMKNIEWRFKNGLQVQWLPGGGGWSNAGIINPTSSYRTP